MAKLSKAYYQHPDVVMIARDLLGKVLCTRIGGCYTTGMISETEAYAGVIDKASHAYANRRTPRTSVMYEAGGVAYVYLCYGMHHLFNVVTNARDIPHAVLIRGMVPLEGIDCMEKRRKTRFQTRGFTDGPGKVSVALGITIQNNKQNLQGSTLWIEDRGIAVDSGHISAGPRIGVGYAGEAAGWPYRFVLNHTGRYK